jgi:integrase
MDIRSWMKWAWMVEKKIRRNPAVGVHQEPVVNERCELFCTAAQRDRLISECPREDLKLVLMLGFHAGMRKREIIEAVPSWFDLDEKRIVMRSTPTMIFNLHKRQRELPMREVLLNFLEKYVFLVLSSKSGMGG